jgi:hypothetical protein
MAVEKTPWRDFLIDNRWLAVPVPPGSRSLSEAIMTLTTSAHASPDSVGA